MNYLHSKEYPIIHRDIKSLNLLVSKDWKTVKLADFGTAKAKKFSSIHGSIDGNPSIHNCFTFSNLLKVGTYRWAAPETRQKKPVWTEKADIYSLGMTFFEIASREVPFADVCISLYY